MKEDGYFYCEDPYDSGTEGWNPDENFFYPGLYFSLTITIDKNAFEAFSNTDLWKYGPETEDPAINRLWQCRKNGEHVVLLIPLTQHARLKIKGTPEVMDGVLFRCRLDHAAKSNGAFPPRFPDDPRTQYYLHAAKRSLTIDC